jgi:hypothetical protein
MIRLSVDKVPKLSDEEWESINRIFAHITEKTVKTRYNDECEHKVTLSETESILANFLF